MEAETETTTTRVTGIKTTYTIHENDETTTTTTTTSQLFDASNSNASEIRVGLPIGVEAVKVRLVVFLVLRIVILLVIFINQFLFMMPLL